MDARDDARERLRRYLEQRRELGETELVLDTLSVEETLRILGARPPGGAGASTPTGPSASSGAPQRRRPQETGSSEPPADWRSALLAAGAGPPGPREAPTVPEDRPAPSPPPTPPEQREKPSAPAATPDVGALPAPGGAGISVGGGSHDLFGGGPVLDSLDDIAATVAKCTRCPLYATAKNPVPGEGNPAAELVLVGEAPGATEDETGRPFVGAAGQLLTKILGAIQLRREDVFICNVLKHRPPGNRNPKPEEVTACSPYLVRQIEIIRPKVILALGTFAAQTLLDTKTPIGKLRGQVHRYYGVPLIVTYHPAALLRNPSWKRPTWEDVQLARRILDSAASGA